jgi:hypothetical protein
MKNRVGSKNWKTGETEIPIPGKMGGFVSLAGLCALCPLSFSNFSKNSSLVKNTSLPVFDRGGGATAISETAIL